MYIIRIYKLTQIYAYPVNLALLFDYSREVGKPLSNPIITCLSSSFGKPPGVLMFGAFMFGALMFGALMFSALMFSALMFSVLMHQH